MQGSGGFSLASDFPGRGDVTEALFDVVRLAFEELGLRSIWATVDARNERSCQVLERSGYRSKKRMAGYRSAFGRVPGLSPAYAGTTLAGFPSLGPFGV